MQDYPPYPPFMPPMPPIPPVPPVIVPTYLPWVCLATGLGGWLIPFFGGLAAMYTGYVAQRQMRAYAAYYGMPYPHYGLTSVGLVLGIMQLGFFLVACCAGAAMLAGGGWGWPYFW